MQHRHSTPACEHTDPGDSLPRERRRRRLPGIIVGALLLTAGPFAASSMASALPDDTLDTKLKHEAVITEARALEVAAAPEWTRRLQEARDRLADALAHADALLTESDGRLEDPAPRDALAASAETARTMLAAPTPSDDLLHDESHAEAAATAAELEAATDALRAALDAASGQLDPALADEEGAEGATAAAAHAPATPDPGASPAPDTPQDANGADGRWTIHVTGHCADPSCAQSAVDSHDFAYVDYGTGFQTFAGHDWGPAGIIQQMQVGHTVTVTGVGAGTYVIVSETYVPETATTLDVVSGLALQTCTGDGMMTLKYLAAA